ncbi:uncharacterized protein sll1483-like [Anneissia japonica]|uniref:uncharacterized protein sll1483-like n=1 Tax=Anneissia japonica TaxID=1529436 RepID=UPI001425BB44|nr:uncharacterized protein sll1483-like [Anneissia japonica]
MCIHSPFCLLSLAKGFPLTMFSPTNSAFDKLPPGTLDNLLKNTTELKTILSNHFVAGDFYAIGLQDGYRIRTIAGDFINVAIDGGVIKVNNATVTFADISVTNGVMHAIDTVLFLP